MPRRMRQPKGDEKLKSLAAYVPDQVYQQVDRLAERRRWSISVAVGYLIEQGLRATEGGADILSGVVKDDATPVEISAEHKTRKTK
jgi:hypothetical protein